VNVRDQPTSSLHTMSATVRRRKPRRFRPLCADSVAAVGHEPTSTDDGFPAMQSDKRRSDSGLYRRRLPLHRGADSSALGREHP